MTATMREQFIAWQCRIRQMSIRDHEGEPLEGMKARIEDTGGRLIGEAVTVVIVHKDPAEATDAFRHIVKKTHDPKSRRDDALKLLSSTHYQYPDEFSDCFTALFSEGSGIAKALSKDGRCRLSFSQFGQSFTFLSGVSRLNKDDAAWAATFWHNHMFNPGLSETVSILQFSPDWLDS
ncbi:MAG: hypothetical protein HQ504_05830 [Rhodospirillaceae bacterium]|nr:hypothetical protein [Rhodospirillaceae bacterium]